MKDIEKRADIELAVNIFYEAVKQNDILQPIFEDVARIDWTYHLPRMYDFWETLLLGKEGYKGNPMLKHISLSKQTEMGKEQFDTWLNLWRQTIDKNFEGSVAEEAKQKANNIMGLMLYKIQNV